MAFEATPILIDGVLYVSTPYGHVHAINAATGERLWQFDAHLPNDRTIRREHVARRERVA